TRGTSRDRTSPSTRGSCSPTSRRESSRHPDRLDVDELLEPVLRQLAPVPRELDATERQPGVGLHEPVDENRADLELARQPLAPRGIPGPHGGAEAVAGRVGRAHGLRPSGRPPRRATGPPPAPPR